MPLITNALVYEALRRGKAIRENGQFEYIRFKDEFRGIERGTVLIGKRVIWGFPHIKRIFTLEKGLGRNMGPGRIFAEEKIDGFNVRIALVEGKVCAFSRGGFLDSFVTEKAGELKLERFFRDCPGHILCGEMIGNTPYTEPTSEFDVKLFVFDIDEGDGAYLPAEQKYGILKKYSINGTPLLGKFDSGDHQALGKLAIALNKGKKEGMVLKAADRKEAVKYVTPWSDIDDIRKESGLLFDMPAGFFHQRVLRSSFFISDFALPKDQYAGMLGRAFYEGLFESIRKAGKGEPVSSEFEILIRDPGIWNGIRRHMSREVKIEELWRREEDGRLRIRFRKIYKKTSKVLASYAAGKGITD